ncbi:MAG: hypothetical protein LBJ14_00660 [Desulfarculales bacterium]|jgi:hypothetical protein|nr:hypothetical protein [Desulfarculales bacterium]
MIRKILCLLLIVFIASACQTQNYTGPSGDRGYFAAEDLPRVLARAFEGISGGSDSAVNSYFSPVSYEHGRALVTFAPPVYPQGALFVLSDLDQVKSSNTLNLLLPVQPETVGLLGIICVGIVAEAGQPGSFQRNGKQFEDLLHTGGTIEIDGWTYHCGVSQEENIFFFSATAPSGRR